MVQFSGFASLSLCIQLRILHRMQWVSPFGHRGIIALLPAPPTLFAGLHVLHRLSSPRHPPDALIHLTLSFQELLWLCLTFRWLEYQTWISYSDKAYCLLCLNPAFCLSGLSRYNHHPNTVPVFLFLFRRQLTVCNRSIIKNRHIVFVCWFRLSNLLKIDAFNIAISLQIKKKLYSNTTCFNL